MLHLPVERIMDHGQGSRDNAQDARDSTKCTMCKEQEPMAPYHKDTTARGICQGADLDDPAMDTCPSLVYNQHWR